MITSKLNSSFTQNHPAIIVARYVSNDAIDMRNGWKRSASVPRTKLRQKDMP